MFCLNRVCRSSSTATNRSEAESRHWCELHALSISCLDRVSLVWSSFIHYTRKQYTDCMWLAQDIVQFCGTAIKLRNCNNCDIFATRADAMVSRQTSMFIVWGVTHTILSGESSYGFWSVNTDFWYGSFDVDSNLTFESVLNECRNIHSTGSREHIGKCLLRWTILVCTFILWHVVVFSHPLPCFYC